MSAAPRRTGTRQRQAVSLIAWWAALTLILWLLGHTTGHPAGLAPSAASAALLVAVGETGDWVRRRWTARRRRTVRGSARLAARAGRGQGSVSRRRVT
ncbi:hypothetical protein [Streptomyces vilmorinianum]|uniref:hypothetical protein n=1 Tax=Streptomyces vilmorinianum TaxID=3051092 RepID=UPI0020C7CF5D|nr:hypothetical protein [Streptomyces vilmorinianum]